MIRIATGFVLSFVIGAACHYLSYSSMDRVLVRKNQAAVTKHLWGGPTGLPVDLETGAPARVEIAKMRAFSAFNASLQVTGALCPSGEAA